jgi:hypothetical protein
LKTRRGGGKPMPETTASPVSGEMKVRILLVTFSKEI